MHNTTTKPKHLTRRESKGWKLYLFTLFTSVSIIMGGVWPLAALAGNVTGTLISPTSSSPLADALIILTLSQSGIIPGTGVISKDPVTCGTDSIGAIVGVRRLLVVPGATISYASGTAPAATYYVRITYWNATGETQVSPESSFTLVSPGTLTVTSPASVSNASGWKVYIGTSAGAGTLQSTITGFGVNYALTASPSAGAAAPSTNSSICQPHFNDTIIPTETFYVVSVTNSAGTAVPGLSMSWYLSGSTVNVSNSYPLAGNRTARFPLPIFASPASNNVQSIASPITLNGYSLTAGATILPNNASPPATAAGKTVMYTDNSGVFKLCINGGACQSFTSATTFLTGTGTTNALAKYSSAGVLAASGLTDTTTSGTTATFSNSAIALNRSTDVTGILSVTNSLTNALNIISTTTSVKGTFKYSTSTVGGEVQASAASFDLCGGASCAYGVSAASTTTSVFGTVANVLTAKSTASSVGIPFVRSTSTDAGYIIGTSAGLSICSTTSCGVFIEVEPTVGFLIKAGSNAGAPASPGAGTYRFYVDSSDGDKLKVVGSSGTVTTVAVP